MIDEPQGADTNSSKSRTSGDFEVAAGKSASREPTDEPSVNSSAEQQPTTEDDQSNVADLDARVEAQIGLEQERNEWKDQALRAAAELENVRRRGERERSDLRKFGNESLLKDLLPVLDSFDQALPEASQNDTAEFSPDHSHSEAGQQANAKDTASKNAVLSDASSSASPKESGSESYLQGMQMVKKQLHDVLAKHGLRSVASQGAPFDPNVHQAIQKENSSEVTVETIGQEYAKGYELNGRLIRPAMVSVLIPSDQT